MNKDWKNWIFGKAERVLKVQATPQAIKELAWRAVHFAAKCGKSNPLSFALRPLATHKNFRTGVGINIAILVILTAILMPGPSLADSSEPVASPIVVEAGEATLSTQAGVQLPVKNFVISQKYWFLHPGLDLASKTGEPIKPVMQGKIIKAEYNWFGYGNHVIIKHGSGYESLYGHLSKIKVSEGDEVDMDTIIGEVGSTGHSTGPHLHLEVYENGKTINPAPLLGI